MSYDHRNAVIKLRPNAYKDEKGNDAWMTGIDKAVLSCLADHADKETGECFPSYGYIADETWFSRKSIERSIAVLAFLKLITIKTKSVGGKPTNYTVHLEAIENLVRESLGKEAKT